MEPARCLTTMCKHVITHAEGSTQKNTGLDVERGCLPLPNSTSPLINRANSLQHFPNTPHTHPLQHRHKYLQIRTNTPSNKWKCQNIHNTQTHPHTPGGSEAGSEPPLCISSLHPLPAPAPRLAALRCSDWLEGSQEGGPQCWSGTSKLLWWKRQEENWYCSSDYSSITFRTG